MLLPAGRWSVLRHMFPFPIVVNSTTLDLILVSSISSKSDTVPRAFLTPMDDLPLFPSFRRPPSSSSGPHLSPQLYNDLLSLSDRRVWVPDPVEGFLPGWIKTESPADSTTHDGGIAEVVITTTGEMRSAPAYTLSPMNPPQFDGVEDIAELTHLNEASVVNGLRQRYGSSSIYVGASISSCLS